MHTCSGTYKPSRIDMQTYTLHTCVSPPSAQSLSWHSAGSQCVLWAESKDTFTWWHVCLPWVGSRQRWHTAPVMHHGVLDTPTGGCLPRVSAGRPGCEEGLSKSNKLRCAHASSPLPLLGCSEPLCSLSLFRKSALPGIPVPDGNGSAVPPTPSALV